MDYSQWLLPIVVPLIISLLGIWAGRRLQSSQAGKSDAEAAETYTRTSLSLISPLQAQIADMKKEIKFMHDEIAILKAENATLRKQNNDLRVRIRELGK